MYMTRPSPPHDSVHTHGEAPQIDGAREVGPYKLLSVLGDGGMGVVYLAEQAVPVRRRVALKVLKLGMDSEQLVARFEVERQALAVMDHPNIARVVDAGVTPRGRPYFAMEYVRGTPITHYADTHRLTTTERLRLFIDICHAVQHAHHKGVIHRDLKPSNVLVAAGEMGPVVKVIDFGIAKAAGLGLTDRTLVTQLGQMIGTPEYMSPEQAEMSGLDVDTRTDIYSLGVLLYELLVGALPFELSAKPGYVIAHTLRERDVPRPSTRLTMMGDTLDVVAQHRSTTAESLRRTLRGDLDWIILKAMDKDRTHRYETANGLAADIGRHLSDQPVVARPPSAPYRVRKFVRRNRAVVIAAGLAALALATGAAAATLGLLEARQAQQRAERSAATAEQVTDFLVELFRVSDPGEALGSTITAREVLDRGADRIRSELAGQPAVQARLMAVMGEVYRQLGLYGSAQPLLESAVAAAERAPDPEEARLVEALRRLGSVYRMQGDAAAAEAPLRRALTLARRNPRPEPEMLAAALQGLGAAYLTLGRFAEAEPLLSEALAIQEAALGPDHAATAITLSNMAALYLQQRDPARAEPYLRRAIEADERRLGSDHPHVAESLLSLGAIHYRQRRYLEAEEAYLRAQRIWDAVLEPDHPYLAMVHNNLGETRWALQRYDEAEEHLLHALALKERIYDADLPTFATTLKALGNVYRDQGRHAEAEPLYRRALRIREASADVDPADLKEVLEAYARLLRLAERDGEAERLEVRAAALSTSLGPLR
jgi:eukaryotic-like serine/threonine-protein kinase